MMCFSKQTNADSYLDYRLADGPSLTVRDVVLFLGRFELGSLKRCAHVFRHNGHPVLAAIDVEPELKWVQKLEATRHHITYAAQQLAAKQGQPVLAGASERAQEYLLIKTMIETRKALVGKEKKSLSPSERDNLDIYRLCTEYLVSLHLEAGSPPSGVTESVSA